MEPTLNETREWPPCGPSRDFFSAKRPPGRAGHGVFVKRRVKSLSTGGRQRELEYGAEKGEAGAVANVA
jgi:hypothetical protein